MNAHQITARMVGRWCGSYGIVLCPAHDDIQPNMTIHDGDDCEVIVNCSAGCDRRDIKAALRTRGVLPERRGAAANVPTNLSPHREPDLFEWADLQEHLKFLEF